VIEKDYDIKFLVSNFKKQDGYKRSIELSKENNLYRQNYCGCKFALEKQIEDQKLQKTKKS
jgi:predicted adenine nucleotide alpha hydrolase (AANH) superfamily ATPase